jgi:hypothetical protein
VGIDPDDVELEAIEVDADDQAVFVAAHVEDRASLVLVGAARDVPPDVGEIVPGCLSRHLEPGPEGLLRVRDGLPELSQAPRG